MDTEITKQLLNSEPWTEYRTRVDLLGEPLDSSDVISAREQMIIHPKVNSLITELTGWPGTVLSSHKSANQSYHKLSFIADLGFKKDDSGISIVINKILEHISAEGPFQLPMNIPVHFGGTGHDQYAWALCDAPIIVYSLTKFGLIDNEYIVKAKDYLIKLCRDNGYPCAVSKELGKFRGPGRKDDPCPYATMIMLKLINLFDTDKNSDYAQKSIDSLLNLWEQSNSLHPYMFYMGTDFRKLKAPLIWYDILHFADTLSNYQYAINDQRFKDIVYLIEQKVDDNGMFTPESEWKAWKGWDFGQKKQPSAWLTFLVYRIKKRMITNK
ncbi:MAG: hypothetical protein V1904_12280 [Bacteroidota bacterium]